MEAILKELKEGFENFKKAQTDADKSVKDLIKTQEESVNENSAEIKAAIDSAEKIANQVSDLASRIVDAEQKLVKGVVSGRLEPKSLGTLVVESGEYKDFAAGKNNAFKINIQNNTISGQDGSPAANNDTIVQTQRIPGIIPGAFRRLRVRDIIPQGNTTSNLVEFTRELLFTNNAAETAEGATKPESVATFELANTPIVTIAHWLKVTTQIRDDAPALMSYIDTRLRYGVDQREDQQLISGDGVGQNLTGMIISPNFTAFTPISGDTALDTINRVKYLIDSADYQASAIVLNPTDWGNIERLKDSNSLYIIGDPRSALGPFLWGLPVIVTNSMTAGKVLIADFNIAYQYWLRQETTVLMSESDDTNFQKNLITIRAEKRTALAGYVPAATRYGSLTL
ncbi:MAG: phage major capsid protein [Candidatus Omnitrophica bacterium]|nr:phage major capsid protein [Candidatus Omnitrophota bacterium]